MKTTLVAATLLVLVGCDRSESSLQHPPEAASQEGRSGRQGAGVEEGLEAAAAGLSEDGQMRLAVCRYLLTKLMPLEEGEVVFMSLNQNEKKVFRLAMPKYSFQSRDLADDSETGRWVSKETKRSGIVVNTYLRFGGRLECVRVLVSFGTGSGTGYEFELAKTGASWSVTKAENTDDWDGPSRRRARKR